MLFSTWQVSLTRKCVCHSFPVPAALNACLQRQSKKRPHLGIERWNYFLQYSLICVSFLGSNGRTVPLPFKNAQVASPCRERTFHFQLLRIGHRNLTFGILKLFVPRQMARYTRCSNTEMVHVAPLWRRSGGSSTRDKICVHKHTAT
jgi:hypothetical protein